MSLQKDPDEEGAAGEYAQPGDLMIRVSREGDVFGLALYGELDIATAPLLERRLKMAEGVESARVVLDLSGLQFLDSTGLHTLLRAQMRWKSNGRSLSLMRGPRAVQRVFELTGAEQFFDFDD